MLTPYQEIKELIARNLEEIQTTAYPEDALSEWADSEVPVYTHEIISEWCELETNYRDAGQDYRNGDGQESITTLMTYDLYNYYQEQFRIAYADLTEGQEDSE